MDAPNAGPPCPGVGKNWSEVCNRVTYPDGSVRTSLSFKSGGTNVSVAASLFPHPQKHAGCRGLGYGDPNMSRGAGHIKVTKFGGASSSRGASSRGGSFGKPSRSSVHDVAREGNVSSHYSSGLETPTNSSHQSLPYAPPDAPPALFAPKMLKMPVPIRMIPLSPTALLGDKQVEKSQSEAINGSTEMLQPIAGHDASIVETHGIFRPGMPLKRDPYDRDKCIEAKGASSVERLAKYLKGIVQQIDSNLHNKRLPTAERLDTFVSRLVVNMQHQLRHVPKKNQHSLQALFRQHFRKFWNFVKNEKVMATTPEELKWVLVTLVENLVSENTADPTSLKASRYRQWMDV